MDHQFIVYGHVTDLALSYRMWSDSVSNVFRHRPQVRGAQFPDAMLPWPVFFLRWRLIFVCPQYGACLMSSLRRLAF